MQRTMDELRGQHAAQVEVNRALPVAAHVAAPGGRGDASVPSDRVFEVTDGLKHIRNGEGQYERLAPGRRFRPTLGELAGDARALRGKARELTHTERRGLFAGADVGIRSIPMTPGALKQALAEGLQESDFEGKSPEGANGEFTKSQIDALVAARASKVS